MKMKAVMVGACFLIVSVDLVHNGEFSIGSSSTYSWSQDISHKAYSVVMVNESAKIYFLRISCSLRLLEQIGISSIIVVVMVPANVSRQQQNNIG